METLRFWNLLLAIDLTAPDGRLVDITYGIASQSCLDLTRFFDQEDMDIAEMNEEVGLFMASVQAGRCSIFFTHKVSRIF